MGIISIILIVVAIGGFIFSDFFGPILQKVLIPLIENPMGAVLVTIAILVFVINIVNGLINLGRIDGGRGGRRY